MIKKYLLLSYLLIILTLLVPINVLARVTPNDLYQAKRTAFENHLSKISNPGKKQAVMEADQLLNTINQQVTFRFDADIAHLSAILEEEKSRQGRIETVVAYGQGDTQLDTAAYYLNFAAEAVAYQKIQDYTPQIAQGSLDNAVRISQNNLKGNLQTVAGKLFRAKLEISKAIHEN